MFLQTALQYCAYEESEERTGSQVEDMVVGSKGVRTPATARPDAPISSAQASKRSSRASEAPAGYRPPLISVSHRRSRSLPTPTLSSLTCWRS